MRWLMFFITLIIATHTHAAEELDCKSSDQDAFTKTICSKYYRNLRASVNFIASYISPEKSVSLWIKPIADLCKDNTDCIGRELLVEWLKFSTISSNLSAVHPLSNKEVCEDFQNLLYEELTASSGKTQNHSSTNAKGAIYFQVSTQSVRNAFKRADLALPSEESLPYGMGADISREIQIFPLIDGNKVQTGFDIYDGGSLYCHEVYTAVLKENNHAVEFANAIGGCMGEEAGFFTLKKHSFQVKTSPLIDGTQYQVFSVKKDIPIELCTISGKMKLNYAMDSSHCSSSASVCTNIGKEIIKLAKYFDVHRDIALKYPKVELNRPENRLMPNALEDSLPKFGYPSSPQSFDLTDQLEGIGFDIGKYSTFRPWQLFKLNNKKYLLSIIDGQYDFEGYIFFLQDFDKYLEDIDSGGSEAGVGLITVERKRTLPVSVEINYPEAH